MTVQIPSTSTEYVYAPVSAVRSGAAYDPTVDAVDLAFTATAGPAGEPASGDWHAASWDSVGDQHRARILIGPAGTVTLAEGTWHLWVRVHDSPEVPVRYSGAVRIT